MRNWLIKWTGIMLAVFTGPQVFAADGVWTNTASGNWQDSGNWQGGMVAGGEGAAAYITNVPTAHRIITAPGEGVTLGKLVHDRRGTAYQVRFRGGPFLFAPGTPEIVANTIYTLFFNDLQSSNGLIWNGGVVGTDTSYTGPTTLRSGSSYDYMHLGALSQASSISNYLSTGPLIFDGGSLVVSGRANCPTNFSAWLLTAGDTLVRRVSSTLASSPGASVTGTGIPDGTFVKFNIDADTFELSQAATASGTYVLSFGAVSGSQSYQYFDALQMAASGTLEVQNNGGTLTRVEAGDLTGGAFTLTKQGNGTLAVAGGNAFGGTLNLNGGVFESNPKDGLAPIFTNITMATKTFFSIPDPATTATLYNVSGTGELAKAGSGGVVLKGVFGTNTMVSVAEGALTITPPDIPSNSPVAGAWFHVDASDPASLIIVAENGTNFVTRWNDTRTNGVYASAVANKPRPFLREGFQNGRPVVDFGSFNYPTLTPTPIIGYGAYLNWNTICSTLREAFLVFSDTPDCTNIPSACNWSFLLGAYNGTFNFHRGVNGGLFYSGLASANLTSGRITIDEATVAATAVLPSGFHVVSLAGTGPVTASTFASDRSSSAGGQRLAEVLVYTNALSDFQRREIKAYLLRKWLGRDYQGYQSATRSAVGTLKLNGDGVFSVNGGEDLRVGVLEVNGNIVKKGAGTLTAETIRQTSGSLTVEEGAVTLSTSGSSASSRLAGLVITNSSASLLVDGHSGRLNIGWLDAIGTLTKSGSGNVTLGALGSGVDRLDIAGGSLTMLGADVGSWFHVDASDPASMTIVAENGTNFVTRWNDTQTNGVYASSVAGKSRPFLREGFQNGHPVVDFGGFNYPALGITNYGAYLNWNTACSAVRDTFLVFSDTPDCTNIPPACNWSFLLGAVSTFHFHRGFYGALFLNSYVSANLRTGGITVDGTNVSSSALLPSGFQVIGLAPTGAVTASAFAYDRNTSSGGQRLAEVLVYTNTLADTVRQGIRSHLLGKWKGVARAFRQLRVTEDSAVAVPDGVLAVDTLEGGGGVSATRLSASYVSPGDMAGEIGTLSVSSVLELADGAVVTVDCAPPACDRVDVDGTLRLLGGGTFAVNCASYGFGSHSVVLFTFSTVEGAENLAGWTVTGEILSRYTVHPHIEGNQLLLAFEGKGTVILIK